MEEILTIRVPKGSRRKLALLAKRKHQNLSQYVREAIEAKLWVDALDETSTMAASKSRELGIRSEDDVFKLFS